MEKENQIFGIRAIIEAIVAGKEVDKVFIQKDAQGELMQELLKTMKKNNINYINSLLISKYNSFLSLLTYPLLPCFLILSPISLAIFCKS